MDNTNIKSEIYGFIKGFQQKKRAFLCALPLAVYVLYRLWYRFIHHRIGLRVNKLVLGIVCAVFLVSLVIIIMNMVDMLQLRSRIFRMDERELKVLEDDFRFGNAYLDRDVIVGRRYIIAKGSMRLFSFDELQSVFDDIRETQSVFGMIISGSNDVVKTKIIKADYKDSHKGHDLFNCRRMCAVEVHRLYSSCVGQTNGYEQIEAIEKDIFAKLNGG